MQASSFHASGEHPYEPDVYTPDVLGDWQAMAARQAAKDRVLFPPLLDALGGHRLLEVASGAGQLALLARSLGRDVTASDYAPFFVEHLRAQGLPAHRVDATDIQAAGLGRFDGIFCQGGTPFVTTDRKVVHAAFRSVFAALRPGGRFLLIHGVAIEQMRFSHDALGAQLGDLAAACGFVSVESFRNQVLPSWGYRVPVLPAMAERLLGRRFGVRLVLLATRPA